MMINGVEHLFVYLLAICISSFEKGLFRLFAYFLIWFFVVVIELYEFLCTLDINPLLSMWFVDIFSYPIGCLLILLMVSFAVQKVFKSGIASLVFVFGVKSKTSLSKPMSVISVFSSRSFMVSGLIVKSLIHFELIFVYGVR